ncbi:MAG: DUF523 domain-containing protein [Candidatus Cloacimonetes bacterium]|jgi:uncharacterized protein YbbK (DUF523 family)|nr:DUF523 domain-containing protein [Candidatus Cloacimonadota bacterium]
MIIVSACLAGIKCTYDSGDNANQKVIEMIKKGFAIPVCPEQLGGLPTPRIPAEISENKIINKNGEDVSNYFKKGAKETLRIAELIDCKKAILKQCSPSCGYGKIYDGTHTGKIINGLGITAKLLEENGIKIITEEDL